MSPVQVVGPDQRTYQFPDGTDKAAAIAYFKKKGIGAKQPTALQPEARTVGNYLSEAAGGVGRGLAGVGEGLFQMATHPQEAASQFTVQAMAAPRMAAEEFKHAPGTIPQRGAAAALRGLEEAPVLGPIVQHAEQGGSRMASPESVGAATEAITTLEAPELVGRGVGKFIKKAPDVARAVGGTGPALRRHS